MSTITKVANPISRPCVLASIMAAPEAESPVKLQVNPRHPLVKNLASLQGSNAELAGLISQQLLDNAKVAAGLLEDPSAMLKRNYELMEKLSSQ